MNRKTIKRIVITVGVTAGFLTVTAGQASAGLVLNNHSEPTLRTPLTEADGRPPECTRPSHVAGAATACDLPLVMSRWSDPRTPCATPRRGSTPPTPAPTSARSWSPPTTSSRPANRNSDARGRHRRTAERERHPRTDRPGTTAATSALVKLGDLVRFQGHFDQAEEILTRALIGAPTDADGDEPPVRALVLNALGIVYKDTGRYDAAQIAYAEAFELVTTACAPDDPAAAPLWHNVAASPTPAARPTKPRQPPPERWRAASVRSDPAITSSPKISPYRAPPSSSSAVRPRPSSCSVGPSRSFAPAVQRTNTTSPSTSATWRPADCRRNDGGGAEALFREGLLIKQAIFGGHHPEIARQLNNLAVAVAAQHRLDEARELHRQALSIAQHTLPADHPLTSGLPTERGDQRGACARQPRAEPCSSGQPCIARHVVIA